MDGVGWLNGANPQAGGPGVGKRTKKRLNNPVSCPHAQLLHKSLPLGPPTTKPSDPLHHTSHTYKPPPASTPPHFSQGGTHEL